MPRPRVTGASIVVLGRTFTPSLLTPDLFRRFFPGETPRGISTNMISQVEYPQSKYSVTLEEAKLQVLKLEPTQSHLQELSRLTSYFLAKNQLVNVTAVGLNFQGFVRYSAPSGRRASDPTGEARFLAEFAAPDALAKLVGSEIESGMIQVVYVANGSKCRLGLRSDGKLNDNMGVALDLNVHQDVSNRRAAKSQISAIRRWYRHFFQQAERLTAQV